MRERLRALVNRMTDKDLERRIDGDWTVAALLAHLAFWDYRVLVLLN
jgi:sulfur carrier protein ThiS